MTPVPPSPPRGVQLFDPPVQPEPVANPYGGIVDEGAVGSQLLRRESSRRKPVPAFIPSPRSHSFMGPTDLAATTHTVSFQNKEHDVDERVEDYPEKPKKAQVLPTRNSYYFKKPALFWDEKKQVGGYSDVQDERAEARRKLKKRVAAWGVGIVILAMIIGVIAGYASHKNKHASTAAAPSSEFSTSTTPAPTGVSTTSSLSSSQAVTSTMQPTSST